MRKKKHHYIPKFYLYSFCDQDGMVWTYHKKKPCKIHRQKPENIAFTKNFYSIYCNDGTRDTNTFEDALADIIESPAANALKTLQSGLFPSNDDRQHLSLFLGFLLVRTPYYRSFFEQPYNQELNSFLRSIATNKEAFRSWADEYKVINGEPLTNNIEQLRQEILNGVFSAQIHPNFSLYGIQKLAFQTAWLLADMKWIIIHAPNNLYFLTSDNPITVINSVGIGAYSPSLLMENAKVFFPASKKTGLLMIKLDKNKLDNQVICNNSNIVDNLNKNTILHSSKFIYAHEKSEKIIKLLEE